MYTFLIVLLIFLFYLKSLKEPFEDFVKKLMFIHIPKTAGTSVEAYGKKNKIKWGRHIKYPRPIKKINTPYWHIPPKYFKKQNSPYKDKKLFAIVRNPYDRIVSEYKYRKEIFTKNKKKTNKNDLNKFIHGIESKYKKNKFCLDGHLIPQNEFIDSNTIVLKLENLDKEFPKLMKEYGYPEEILPKSYKTSKNVSKKDLDKKSINIINKIYHQDFKDLGYTKF